MSVLGRVILSSAERLDLADVNSIDSYITGDFKYLIRSLIGIDRPYILRGFDVIDPSSALGSASLSVRVADSVVFYPASNAGPFFHGLPEGNAYAVPLAVSNLKAGDNYIYAILGTSSTSSDNRAFWDPDKNGGEGGEFSRIVDTESILIVEVNTSVSTFPDNTVPICKVTCSNSGIITAIEDSRDLMFRLGTGGITPNIHNTYSFRSLPSSTYSRIEPPITMTQVSAPNPFQGGDKNIYSLKEWMDVVMTKLLELSGTAYWYEQSPSISLATIFQDTLGSVLKSKGSWEHDATVPGKVTWTADIVYKNLSDPRESYIRAGNVTLSNEQVAYIEIIRGADINSGPVAIDWINAVDYVNGLPLSFENLSKGDWVKKKTDTDSYYLRVEEFYASANKGGGATSAAAARSVQLSGVYVGLSETAVAVYTKGEYASGSIQIADRDDPALAALGGSFMWLAARSDTTTKIASASSYTLIGNIINNNSVTATFHSVAHGLVDGDRFTIVGSTSNDGTYVVEKIDNDNLSILAKVGSTNETGVSAHYGLITTAARNTSGGFNVETAEHGMESNDTAHISGTTNYNGAFTVNVRGSTVYQIAMDFTYSTETNPASGLSACVRAEVRKPFGSVKIVQGEWVEIGEIDGVNIQHFIGMLSLSEMHPTYLLPTNYPALNGSENYGCDSVDNLTVRAAKLTAMMSNRIQDRGMRIVGQTTIRNTTSGANQAVTASSTVTLIKPVGNSDTVTLSCSLPTNSVAVLNMDRQVGTALTLTVESLNSSFLLSENKLIIFYRFGDSNVYAWDGHRIAANGSYTASQVEASQNKNVMAYYPAEVDLDITTNIFTFNDPIQDMEIIINGSTNNNTVDTSAINGLGGISLPSGNSIWVRINRTANKTFNTIATSDSPDTDINGKVYSTSSGSVPTDQDVFVLFARQGNALLSFHRPTPLKENVYEEFLTVIAGIPSDDHEIQGPVVSGTTIVLPSDSRDSGNPQYYIVGAGHLELYLNGQYLRYGTDWTGVGLPGALSMQIQIQLPLEIDDILMFREDTEGGIYFANSAPLSFTMQDTYDAGRFISVNGGQPIVITAPSGTKGIQINGDLGVSGLIDPTGLVLDPQSSDPMSSSQKGLWVNSSNELIYKKTDLVSININTDFVRRDGTLAMTANLNMNTHKITSLTDPSDAQDAATKNYTDGVGSTAISTCLRRDGTNAMTANLNVDTHKVVNVVDPSDAQDAATKNYSDTTFLKLDGTNPMAAALNMGTHRITSIVDPSSAQDAATKNYADTTFLKLDGTNPMAAALNMGTHRITSVVDPSSAQDAATKNYADTTFLKLDGTNPMAAALNMGTHKITSVVDPVGLQDAATKNYVDGSQSAAIAACLKLDGTNSMGANLNAGTHKVVNVTTPDDATDAATKGYVDDYANHKNLYISLVNSTGSQINAGSVVRLNTTTAKQATLATASSLNLSEGVVGIAVANIPNGNSGYIQLSGEVTVLGGPFNIGRRVYVSDTTAGYGTYTPPTMTGTVVFFLGVASDTNKVILSPNLDAINDNVYDETLEILVDAAAPSVQTLPNDSRNGGLAQYYTVGEGMLEVYLNGQYLELNDDWEEIGSTGDLTATVRILQGLIVGDKLTFRINIQNSAYFVTSSGPITGSLQAAYGGGRFINVTAGQPIEISGSSGKLLTVLGDMEVTGVVDPKGVTFTPLSSNPLTSNQAGLWCNSSGQLMSQDGSGSDPINVIQAIEATTPDNISTLLDNYSGNTIPIKTVVSADSNGNIIPVDVSDESVALSIVGITINTIDDESSGRIVTHGLVRNIDTLAPNGSAMYIAKNGSLTHIKPTLDSNGFTTGDFVIRVGVLVKDINTPSQKNMIVNPQIIGQL